MSTKNDVIQGDWIARQKCHQREGRLRKEHWHATKQKINQAEEPTYKLVYTVPIFVLSQWVLKTQKKYLAFSKPTNFA